MTELAERLKRRYFGRDEHPYRTFERRVEAIIRPEMTLLDAGCGYTAPVLQKFRGQARRLVGIDVVDFKGSLAGIELYRRDLSDTGLAPASVDIIMARSVIEHIAAPAAVLGEFARILKPGGRLVFLTANLYDYVSLIARIVPNRLHPWIVAHTEGRAEEDVFPIQYKLNTRRAVSHFSSQCGFEVASFCYLGQYPGYFMFNGPLFLLATGYEKLISRFSWLHWLRGWILAELRKS